MQDKKQHEADHPQGAVCLQTKRLRLRPLELDDAQSLFVGLGCEKTMRYWSCGPKASIQEVREYMQPNVRQDGVQGLAVTETDGDGQALGWVVLMDKSPGVVEMGFLLRPDACGVGYAREAVGALLSHAFKVRGLRRIMADVDPDNGASLRCLLALGFQKEGHLRATWETHIGVRDSVILGLLAGDNRP